MKTLLLGDVCPTTVTAPLFTNKNISELFTDVASIFDNKDFVFANLECALTDHDGKIQKFGPCLKAPKETAAVLKELGVDCCGLSNNHIFDYGIKGVADTIQALNDVGIEVTGFGNNYEDARKNYTIENNGENATLIFNPAESHETKSITLESATLVESDGSLGGASIVKYELLIAHDGGFEFSILALGKDSSLLTASYKTSTLSI
jgi:poly-gamma-glutamate capsule biosynthesis protein CapA/YwtB (metallophosphatase superfamily)